LSPEYFVISHASSQCLVLPGTQKPNEITQLFPPGDMLATSGEVFATAMCVENMTKKPSFPLLPPPYIASDADSIEQREICFFPLMRSVTVCLTYAYVCVCLRMLTYADVC
jgi:hypothetical protein